MDRKREDKKEWDGERKYFSLLPSYWVCFLLWKYVSEFQIYILWLGIVKELVIL